MPSFLEETKTFWTYEKRHAFNESIFTDVHAIIRFKVDKLSVQNTNEIGR